MFIPDVGGRIGLGEMRHERVLIALLVWVNGWVGSWMRVALLP